MDTKRAYIAGIHRYTFRAGEPAEILDTVFIQPDFLSAEAMEIKIANCDEEWCVCFRVRFMDDVEDYIPLSDLQHYKIISVDEIVVCLKNCCEIIQ